MAAHPGAEHREKELREELARLQQQRMKGQHAVHGNPAIEHDAHAVRRASEKLGEVAKHLKSIVPTFRKNPLLVFTPVRTLPDHFRDYANAQKDFERAVRQNNPGAVHRARGRMAEAAKGILSLSIRGKLEFEIMEKAAHHAFNELK